MATYWKFNERRRRFELVEADDRTNQVLRVLEAFIDPATDNSDLRGVPVDNLPPDVIAALTPAAQGDPQARQQVSALYGSLMQQSLDQHGQGNTFALINRQRRAGSTADGQTGVRMEPEDITAQVNRFNAALDVRSGAKLLDQKEHELRQKMLAEGFDPEEFFGAPGGQPAGFPQGPGAAPQTTTTGAYLPAAYINAYTAQDQAAAAAANMARAERLQEAANRFGLRKTGADNLRSIADVRQEIDDLQAHLAASEMKLTANPKNDRSLGTYPGQRPGQDPDVHGENASIAQRLVQLRREYDRFVDNADPRMAAERRRQEHRQRGWQAIPEAERRRRWGAVNLSDDVRDEDLYPAANYGYRPYRMGGTVPRFDGGGTYLPLPPGTPASGGNPPPRMPVSEQPDPEAAARKAAAEAEAAAKERARETRLAEARRRADEERIQAQQAFDQQMVEIQYERAVIGAQMQMRGLNGGGTPSYAGG